MMICPFLVQLQLLLKSVVAFLKFSVEFSFNLWSNLPGFLTAVICNNQLNCQIIYHFHFPGALPLRAATLLLQCGLIAFGLYSCFSEPGGRLPCRRHGLISAPPHALQVGQGVHLLFPSFRSLEGCVNFGQVFHEQRFIGLIPGSGKGFAFLVERTVGPCGIPFFLPQLWPWCGIFGSISVLRTDRHTECQSLDAVVLKAGLALDFIFVT